MKMRIDPQGIEIFFFLHSYLMKSINLVFLWLIETKLKKHPIECSSIVFFAVIKKQGHKIVNLFETVLISKSPFFKYIGSEIKLIN